MHDGLVVKGVAVIICAAALSACSLWLNTEERQCQNNTDCVTARLGNACVQQVCMESSACGSDGCDAATSQLAVTSCDSDSDCGTANPRCLNSSCVDSATGDRWLCPTPEGSARAGNVRYNFHVIEFVSRNPPKNIVAKACRSNDVSCAEPVAVFEDVAQTGMVQMVLPGGFTGYFEVKSDAIDTLLFITKPIVKNTLDRDLPVLSLDTVDVLASILGYSYDPEKGLAILDSLNCNDDPQGGIHYVSEEGGDPFYLVNQLPNRDTQVSVYDSVNNSANGGFINVLPGFIKFTAQLGVDGFTLGAFNARIRPRTVTFIDMYFSP
jgi:hypothetical protein